MKYGLFLVAIALVLNASAKITPPKTEAERQQRREAMLRITGGLVDVPAQGKVVIVNAQTKIPRKEVEAVAAELAKLIKFNVEVQDGKLDMYTKPAGANAAVVLAECPDLPMSVVAAENSWGLANISTIATGDETKNLKRFKRLFARVVTFAFGQSCSQYQGSPLKSVVSPEDLDRIPTDGITFDAQTMIEQSLRAHGMTQTRKTSYRKACEEGWASAPTNEYQKAIWDKVHEMPTAPIRIKPETKKVAE